MQFKIEKNIQIPPKRVNPLTLIIGQMSVGDSIKKPDDMPYDHFASSCANNARNFKFKLIVRTFMNKGKKETRCWRTE